MWDNILWRLKDWTDTARVTSQDLWFSVRTASPAVRATVFVTSAVLVVLGLVFVGIAVGKGAGQQNSAGSVAAPTANSTIFRDLDPKVVKDQCARSVALIKDTFKKYPSGKKAPATEQLKVSRWYQTVGVNCSPEEALSMEKLREKWEPKA